LHEQQGNAGLWGRGTDGRQSASNGSLSAGVASTLGNRGSGKADGPVAAAAAGLIQSGRMDSIDRLTALGAQQFYQKANRQLSGASLKLKLSERDIKGDSRQV
jgi:hypothetical protein